MGIPVFGAGRSSEKGTFPSCSSLAQTALLIGHVAIHSVSYSTVVG